MVVSFAAEIVDISSMLAETENLRFNRSSTAAIMIEVVKWAYFRCHVYESNDTSFFSSRRFGLLDPRRVSERMISRSDRLPGSCS